MEDDLEWFMDWRVWAVVVMFSMVLIPIFFKQMVKDIGMPIWKAVFICTIGVVVSYIPGKIIIERGN